MAAWYNEIDPFAAQWLRNLIAAGYIADGIVDERDIRDVRPDELDGYDQCHFFAGIGGWSYALRLAGWPDDRPAWTGSCPCQPFSAAGRRKGAADERHLWPHWFWLISQRRPAIIFGEQVASKDGLGWFDLVSADLEGADYAIGAADLCAAGVEAPHIRQRLWFVANASGTRGGRDSGARGRRDGGTVSRAQAEGQRERFVDRCGAEQPVVAGELGELADRFSEGLERRDEREVGHQCAPVERSGCVVELADADGRHAGTEGLQRSGQHGQQSEDGGAVLVADAESRCGSNERVGDGSTGQHVGSVVGASGGSGMRNRASRNSETPTGDARTPRFWSSADWIYCRDGKYRPVEPGTFPLAHGIPGRVGKLRAYGNAIVPQVAAEFISSTMS
jgi:DNA (cytosine-5)-methyltransferase 1